MNCRIYKTLVKNLLFIKLKSLNDAKIQKIIINHSKT